MKNVLLIGLLIGQLLPQSLDVTFKYVTHPGEEFIRIFVPGTMPPGSNEDWGPNSNGMINSNAPSKMNYDEAIDAFQWISEKEGILPALETSHAISYLKMRDNNIQEGADVIVCLSGRGDKDVHTVASYLGKII